ncbi:MAG TPA: AsnC family transcriptional regulator, partial [Nitrososphaerales archaeon]|nr:AsnC family transcriptional regulator [Nitrososphaerales archaeon]
MDELDVKILRALISESAIAPSNIQINTSIRKIAKRLGADDMTVSIRFRKLQDSGCMSVWKLAVNPTFFGYNMLDVMVDVEPESGKADMIRKLKLVHEIIVIVNFYGKGLKIIMLYNGEKSRSRTVELISRITNAEKVTLYRIALPRSETAHLTETDLAIVLALADDARKSPVLVAKQLGLSTRTVSNRIEKLRKEKTLFTLPNLSLDNLPGVITVYLSYSYTNKEMKGSVDRVLLSHFDPNYLWGGFSDTEQGYLVLNAATMADVERFLEWTREQPGIVSVQVNIPVKLISFPEKLAEL